MAKIIRINKVKSLNDYVPVMSVALKEELWKKIRTKIDKQKKATINSEGILYERLKCILLYAHNYRILPPAYVAGVVLV